MNKCPTVCFSVILGLALLSGHMYSQRTEKFRFDDPLRVDPDQMPIPRPKSGKASQIFDFMENTFSQRPEKDEVILPAENVNTLGEVPDSSWFTNRMSRELMTTPELVRGPNQVEGPDQSLPWLIVGVKSEGITPGFTIRDARGDIYFIKFDPPGHPQLTTSTEVIATKFFHAFGYHVPENYLTFIRRRDVTISLDEGICSPDCEILGHQHDRATLVDEEGKERPVREADIDKIFERVYRDLNGRTPVVASRRLPGIPLGPFNYFGTRSDDPNDIFAHQNRRELRGLRLFAAWLNHDDSRRINSLDMYVGEPGQGHVKHHLIDFGSCFGSGSVKVQSRRAGNEYMLEWGPIVKAALTLGLWDRPWRHVKYPDYPAVGRFEGDFFEPQLWRPEYPNPAFDRMQSEDAFWAVRIVMRFSDEMIRALVRTGQISDPKAEQYLAQTLIKRRDKIVRYYLGRTNPLSDFEVVEGSDGQRLQFKNLGIEGGLTSSCSYRYQWFRFDNFTQSQEAIGQPGSVTQTTLPLPRANADYLMVRLHTENSGQEDWDNPVSVFIRNNRNGPTVIGIERQP